MCIRDRTERERETERERGRDGGLGMVVIVGGFAEISVCMVRLLRYLGSSSRCLLPNHQYVTNSFNHAHLSFDFVFAFSFNICIDLCSEYL